METLENEIVQLAVNALKKDITLDIQPEVLMPTDDTARRGDFIVTFTVQGREFRYFAEVKTLVTKATKLLALVQKEKTNLPYLLVTRYVNPEMAEQLKADDLQFIDTAGNAYIKQLPLYIFVKGNRPPEITMRAPQKRAFKPTGLKVIYALLCNPGLENKPYRDIADAADVALGTIGWMMRELKQMDYLLDMGKRGKKLTQKEALLQRWVTEYPERLRPKHVVGRYRGPEEWWQQTTLDPVIAQWGGEVAAQRYTNYLKPQVITLYTNTRYLNQLLMQHRLKRDPQGDIEILERFWKTTQEWQYGDKVHPLLVYADLMATGNERNIEVAKMIYEEYLAGLVRQN
ncbi:MAG: type IV toxin-antitoxin system AbiEi family antitoxin [Nitrospirota bacterium]